jgi:hemerythrin
MKTTPNTETFLTWDDSWLVGVREVDGQHRHLVSLLNFLHQSMSRGQGKDILAGILTSLVNYTAVHFAAEERLMQKHHYPDLDAHKIEHQELTAKVMEYQRRFVSGEITLSLEVLEFLGNWLRNHIIGSDRKYVPFLRAEAVR